MHTEGTSRQISTEGSFSSTPIVKESLINMPDDFLEMMMDKMDPRDGLQLLTCNKSMMMGLGGKSRLEDQRRMVKEIIQQEAIEHEIRMMDEYEKNLELATTYYRKHNLKLREPGVSCSSVAKLFKVLKCELITEVENAFEEEMYELDSEDEMGNPEWDWIDGEWSQ